VTPSVARAVEETALELGIAHLLGRRTDSLSSGELQRVALAAALVTRPRLLVLDEPTEGIQPSIVEAMIHRIRVLSRSRGLAVLLVEQNLDFIEALADRVLLIHRGRITREIPRGALADPSLVQEFTGTAAA
jgi:ABC-type branched-subunit amino acid transport system ATPase component